MADILIQEWADEIGDPEGYYAKGRHDPEYFRTRVAELEAANERLLGQRRSGCPPGVGSAMCERPGWECREHWRTWSLEGGEDGG